MRIGRKTRAKYKEISEALKLAYEDAEKGVQQVGKFGSRVNRFTSPVAREISKGFTPLPPKQLPVIPKQLQLPRRSIFKPQMPRRKRFNFNNLSMEI